MRAEAPWRTAWRRWRLVIVATVVFLTLLGLVAGALYTYISYRTAAAQLIVQRDRQVALLTAVRLRDELQKLTGELEPMARSQSLYLGLTEKQRLYLRGQSDRLSMFDGGVVLMDNTGRVRATVPERWDIMSMDWSDQEFFRNMLVAPPPAEYFSSILPIGPSNAPVVVVSVPVLGQNGEMVGVLAGLFRVGQSSISAFYASVVRLRLPGTGNTFIVDGNGKVIYDSGYQRTGQVLDLAAVHAADDADQALPRLDAEGNEVVASYAPIPGTKWTLVTETDWSQAMAPVQRFATGIIVLLALGMVIPTAGLALLARGQGYDARDANGLQVETRLGQALQQRLLPRHPPMLGGWELAVHHQSASLRSPGGGTAHDMYDFMLLPDGRLMISLATIADRGLSATYLMTTVRAAFRAAASHTETAANALSTCNNLVCPDVGPDAAVTSLFALLDPESGLLQVANAGFCAPFRWTSGGPSPHDLIAMHEGPDFLGQQLDIEFENDDVLLEPGDSIIFYSPGALGIRPQTGEPFGPERVRRVLNASEATSAQAIVDALRIDIGEFAEASSLRGLDVTLVAVSRPPDAKAEGRPRSNRRALREEMWALGETETDL